MHRSRVNPPHHVTDGTDPHVACAPMYVGHWSPPSIVDVYFSSAKCAQMFHGDEI